jgi:catechol 2,3-dioxygenase-like lactoylglutathione lyase family enzyme
MDEEDVRPGAGAFDVERAVPAAVHGHAISFVTDGSVTRRRSAAAATGGAARDGGRTGHSHLTSFRSGRGIARQQRTRGSGCVTAHYDAVVAATRYLVSDVDAAIEFYVGRLGFHLRTQMGPAFAMVERDDHVLWLSGPESSAARPMPDGAQPQPGGWNRFVIQVDDVTVEVERLRAAGVTFRNEPFSGPGGTQVVLEDPSGNPVELFSPR